MESLKSPRCITIIVLVTVFALGVLTGWSLNVSINRKQIEMTNLKTQLDPAVMEPLAIKWMHAKLDVTDEQVEKVRPILVRGIADIIQMRKEALKKILDRRIQFFEEIRSELTPEQQKKMEQYIKDKNAEIRQKL